jgi:hypothetical protein
MTVDDCGVEYIYWDSVCSYTCAERKCVALTKTLQKFLPWLLRNLSFEFHLFAPLLCCYHHPLWLVAAPSYDQLLP